MLQSPRKSSALSLTIFFITKMHQRTISLSGGDSVFRNKENLIYHPKPTPRPSFPDQNNFHGARSTLDPSKSRQPSDSDSMARFKQTILKERSANIKAYHLKVKDQDDMIKQMRTRMAETKNTQQSLVSSRFSLLGEIDGEETNNITRKLSALEKNLCSQRYLPRKSLRTEYLATRVQSTSDYTKEMLLTPLQQLCVAQLPIKISETVLSVDSNIHKLLDVLRNGQKQHKLLRQDCLKGQQEIDKASEQLSQLDLEKQKQTSKLEAARNKYSEMQESIQLMVAREKRKFLMMSNRCSPSKQ